MRKIGMMWVIVVVACSVGEVPPRGSDGGPDAGAMDGSAGLHDRLTSCPSWTSKTVSPEFCERACEPKPQTIAAGCAGASTPSSTMTVTCSVAENVDGATGCCAMVGSPSHVLFFECPS